MHIDTYIVVNHFIMKISLPSIVQASLYILKNEMNLSLSLTSSPIIESIQVKSLRFFTRMMKPTYLKKISLRRSLI